MPRTTINSQGEEISEADFDDYRSPAYRRAIARYPFCADPDHPGCEKCWDDWDETDVVETAQFNDEPVPYDNNKEA